MSLLTIHLGTSMPSIYKKGELGDTPIFEEVQRDFDTSVRIDIPKDMSVENAVDCILRVWSIHSRQQTPTWISGDNKKFVMLVADLMKITEIRGTQ